MSCPLRRQQPLEAVGIGDHGRAAVEQMAVAFPIISAPARIVARLDDHCLDAWLTGGGWPAPVRQTGPDHDRLFHLAPTIALIALPTDTGGLPARMRTRSPSVERPAQETRDQGAEAVEAFQDLQRCAGSAALNNIRAEQPVGAVRGANGRQRSASGGAESGVGASARQPRRSAPRRGASSWSAGGTARRARRRGRAHRRAFEVSRIPAGDHGETPLSSRVTALTVQPAARAYWAMRAATSARSRSWASE